MSREMKSSNQLCHHHLNNDFAQELKKGFHDILMSIYGPQGSSILLRNTGGEDVYITSSKGDFNHLKFSHPVPKLINAVMDSQNKSYGSHGSYLGILSSGLLYRSITSNVPTRVSIEASNQIIEKLENLLVKKSSFFSHKLDYSKLNNVMKLVDSILLSKANYGLSSEEQNIFKCRIAECFVRSLPMEDSDEFAPLHISTIDGPSTDQSVLKEGLLYREMDKTISQIQSTIDLICLGEDNKIVLFNVPLSFLKDENVSASCSVNSFNQFTVSQLMQFLKRNNVQIIASQKYIDESIKFELERDQILVLERLGTSLTSSLSKMSGAIPLTGFKPEIELSKDVFGVVGPLTAVEIKGKNFLQLSPSSSKAGTTFVIAGLNHYLTSHLEDVTRSCISLLQMMVVRDSRVMIGGGCFEAFLLSLLVEMEHSEAISCDASPQFTNQIFSAFIQTLISLAVKLNSGRSEEFFIDSCYNHLWFKRSSPDHLWSSTCVCGSIKKKVLGSNVEFLSLFSLQHDGDQRLLTNQKWICSQTQCSLQSCSIVDYFPAKMNALRMAFDTFSELLLVGDVMYERKDF